MRAARARIDASRGTIELARACLLRNQHVVERLTADCRASLHDAANVGSVTAMTSALLIERINALVSLSDLRISVGDQLLELGRQRMGARAGRSDP